MSIETKLSCPINRAIAALADKWKILIVLSLQERTVRYGELLRTLDGIAPKVMARQLRGLEKDGLVARTVYAQVPPRVDYALTQAGRSLLPILNDLQRWVMTNSAELSPDIVGTASSAATPRSGGDSLRFTDGRVVKKSYRKPASSS